MIRLDLSVQEARCVARAIDFARMTRFLLPEGSPVDSPLTRVHLLVIAALEQAGEDCEISLDRGSVE